MTLNVYANGKKVDVPEPTPEQLVELEHVQYISAETRLWFAARASSPLELETIISNMQMKLMYDWLYLH